MDLAQQVHAAIDRQFAHNQERCLFFPDGGGRLAVTASPHMAQFLRTQKEPVRAYLATLRASGEARQLVCYLAKRSSQSFVRVNQYISFTDQQIQALAGTYARLFAAVEALCTGPREITPADVEGLLEQHYVRLQQFLVHTNGSAMFEPYRQSPRLPHVPCAEYDARLQLQLLGIDPATLLEPVLDLGCGSQAALVRYLRDLGIAAYGFDRHENDSPYVRHGNWLDLRLKRGSWGTIISHMAFSNHFWHHHMRPDGDAAAYARKYMEILAALKVGGRFIYAPGFPPIEQVLAQGGAYTVNRRPLGALAHPSGPQNDENARFYVTTAQRRT